MLFNKKDKNIEGYGVITMAGASQRFVDEGFTEPKHRLLAFGLPLLYWAVRTCQPFYSRNYKMIFVTNKLHGDEKTFVEEQFERLQIPNVEFVELDNYTDGQATTALMAKGLIKDKSKPIFVYNIDTMIEPLAMEDIYKDTKNKNVFGIIPCCKLEGDHWSFAKTVQNNEVVEIAEKIRISDLATLGFYWFNSWNTYETLYKQTYKDNRVKEKYIAPMYQTAINSNKFLIAPEISINFVACFGTPAQYKAFSKQ